MSGIAKSCFQKHKIRVLKPQKVQVQVTLCRTPTPLHGTVPYLKTRTNTDPWSIGGVVVMVVLSPPEPVLADHATDLHVNLVVDGVTKLYVLIVDCVATVRQSARLKHKKEL
jgi:hypothetical protein